MLPGGIHVLFSRALKSLEKYTGGIALFLIFTALPSGLWAVMPTPTPVAQQAYGTIWDESFYYLPNYQGGPTDYTAPTSDPTLHGVPTDQAYLGSEYDAGLRLKNVYLRWRLFEPEQGNTANAYITEKLEEIRHFREKGTPSCCASIRFPCPPGCSGRRACPV